MIAYFAPDLAWAVRIKSTAESLGISARPARNSSMLQNLMADPNLRALIVDLDDPDIALELIRQARVQSSPIQILAYGPHIARDALDAARAAGADSVLPRGAFHANLIDILKQLDAS